VLLLATIASVIAVVSLRRDRALVFGLTGVTGIIRTVFPTRFLAGITSVVTVITAVATFPVATVAFATTTVAFATVARVVVASFVRAVQIDRFFFGLLALVLCTRVEHGSPRCVSLLT
jgi:hypothetical protein